MAKLRPALFYLMDKNKNSMKNKIRVTLLEEFSNDIKDILIAWEWYKKANWWESKSIDVEKHLMEKFEAIYKR
jgi:hypothetical protein